jgi:hypothetical protein
LVYPRLAARLRGLDPAPSPLAFADAWAIVDWMETVDTQSDDADMANESLALWHPQP